MKNYEKAYKDALERAREIIKDYEKRGLKEQLFYAKEDLEGIFPELKESYDEKVREALIEYFSEQCDMSDWNGVYGYQVIAWLEKQGEKSVEPNWCHHKVDLSDCTEEYRKAYYDGWNNCNQQHSQCKLEKSDVLKCLINGMKFYYEDNEEAMWGTEKFSMKVKDILAWLEKQGKSTTIDIDKMVLKYSQTREPYTNGLPVNCQIRAYRQGINDTLRLSLNLEKQGEQKVPINDFKAKNWYVSEVDGKIHDMTYNPIDKVEPKFKVGDWIANDYCTGKVIALTDDAYLLDSGQGIPFSCEHNAHLWTIDDAKDGDVLYSLDSKQPFVFKYRKPNEQAVVYCGLNIYGKFFVWGTKDCVITLSNYIPATKEQRDTLLKAMADAGYTFDFEKKELKLLISNGGDFESPTCWSKEDEDFYNDIIKYFSDLDYSLSNDEDDVINWLKSLKERLS